MVSRQNVVLDMQMRMRITMEKKYARLENSGLARVSYIQSRVATGPRADSSLFWLLFESVVLGTGRHSSGCTDDAHASLTAESVVFPSAYACSAFSNASLGCASRPGRFLPAASSRRSSCRRRTRVAPPRTMAHRRRAGNTTAPSAAVLADASAASPTLPPAPPSSAMVDGLPGLRASTADPTLWDCVRACAGASLPLYPPPSTSSG
mmetsp:Transcript_20285/g.69059  ORF Transcript_20285/g.69059 Transcript_20285/m.69059 type:complete len:207 (+) Transcript_20285:1191-1811(+)